MILVSLDSDQTSHAAQASTIQQPVISNERHIYDTFNQWVRMDAFLFREREVTVEWFRGSSGAINHLLE